MRTTENWNSQFREKFIIKFFPPRIQKDLLKINLENLGEIQSTFIYGKIKTGKTVLAASMMLEYIKQQYLNADSLTSIFISFPEILSELKHSFNNKITNEYATMKIYAEAPFLVIDDFLASRPTDWVMEVVYYLINHRYDYLLPTIITCNYSLSELEEVLGDQRIPSRIERMCENIIEKQPYK